MMRRSSRQHVKFSVLLFVAGVVAITAMPALASGHIPVNRKHECRTNFPHRHTAL